MNPYLEFRKYYEFGSLLSKTDANPKIRKSNGADRGYLSTVMHLAAANVSGFEVCPWRTDDCTAACLGRSSGRAGIRPKDKFNPVQIARLRRTRLFADNRVAFIELLNHEIGLHVKRSDKLGLIPALRLNATSDLSFENMGFMQQWPEVQFYDYTKGHRRAMRSLTDPTWPSNYHLTYSHSGYNVEECRQILESGGVVATVFSELPDEWIGYPVHDADSHDLRFLDPPGSVAGLTLKTNKTGQPIDYGRFVVEVTHNAQI